MKKALWSVIVIAMFQLTAFAKTTFVMLPMENGGVTALQLDEAYNSFYLNLNNSKKFNIADRDKLKNILSENRLELTGLAENKSEISKIGKLLGADKLISSKIYPKYSGQVAIFFQVIDVATAQVEMTKEIYYLNYSPEADGGYCAAEIAANYPLIGEVLAVSGDTIIINLGVTDGLKEGDRIFVSHNDTMYGDNKEVLYVETKRVAVLRVTGLMGGRAKTKVETLTDPKENVRKGDSISPEPIPRKDTVISKEPLLSKITKGTLLLDDDMQRKKYLSPVYNNAEGYFDGKLNLCSTNNRSGHAYAFYPMPYDNLSNFIMEGEVEFKKISGENNRFEVVFRCNGNYLKEVAYSFFWEYKGSFAVSLISTQLFNLVPQQSSPAINRGEGMNRFRIAAYGPKFDLYLNDQFIVGFEDERLEKGVVGFECANGGHVMVDNVRIWEAVYR